MNTADRSVGYIDYAIRRRFAFETIQSNGRRELNNFYQKQTDDNLKSTAIGYFNKVRKFIESHIAEDYDADALMVGHSYFMAGSDSELSTKLEYEIKPLLIEYYRDGIIFCETGKKEINDLFDEDVVTDGQ